jgi:hypothetical protein
MVTSHLRRQLCSSQLRIRESEPCCGPDIAAQFGVTGGGSDGAVFSRYGSVDTSPSAGRCVTRTLHICILRSVGN